QADDLPGRHVPRVIARQVVELHLGEGVDVRGRGRLVLADDAGGDAIRRGRRRINNRRLAGRGELEQTAKSLDVVVRLEQLVVLRGVRDRRLVEDRVEREVFELLLPVEARDIAGHEVAAEPPEVFEVTRAKVID